MKTLDQLIADSGIDEAREIRLMNRRARAALLRDRTKVYASTPLGNIPVFGRDAVTGRILTREDVAADLGALRHGADSDNTELYIKVWCRLNHLVA